MTEMEFREYASGGIGTYSDHSGSTWSSMEAIEFLQNINSLSSETKEKFYDYLESKIQYGNNNGVPKALCSYL